MRCSNTFALWILQEYISSLAVTQLKTSFITFTLSKVKHSMILRVSPSLPWRASHWESRPMNLLLRYYYFFKKHIVWHLNSVLLFFRSRDFSVAVIFRNSFLLLTCLPILNGCLAESRHWLKPKNWYKHTLALLRTTVWRSQAKGSFNGFSRQEVVLWCGFQVYPDNRVKQVLILMFV